MKLRIAQVTPGYYPHIGGVEKVVQSISEEMVKKGHEVEVLTIGAQDVRDKGEQPFILNDVAIKRFPASGPFRYAKGLYSHLIAQKLKYDIVHAHSFHTLLPLLACQAKEKAGFKLILTGYYHGQGGKRLTNLLLHSGRFWFSRVYQKADLILGLTEFEKCLLKQHFHLPESKIRIIPSGVAVEKISCVRPLGKSGEEKILLIVSRLEKYKNIHLAIRAVPYLPEDYRLVIIGDGPYRQQLESYVNTLDLKERVSFLGQFPEEEVYQWYKICNLVLNLSSLESFGLTVIEALAAGKPVLVNNISALNDLAQKFTGATAVNIRQTPPQELARVIKECVLMPYPQPNLSEYRWETIAEKITNTYKTIL